MLQQLVTTARKTFHRARGFYPATIMGHRFRLDPYHTSFWRKAGRGAWEPTTFDVLNTYLTSQSTFVDIGAWIGPVALPASRICARVYCFEPDPVAYSYLSLNLELNAIRNVSAFAVAIAAERGLIKMASFGGEPGDSMTSLLLPHGQRTIDALAITWSDFVDLASPERVDLIKIDIEGAEFDLIPTMTDYLRDRRPAVLLSTHAPYLAGYAGREAMARLAEVLSFYPNVFDGALRPMALQKLTSKHAAEGYGSYLFAFK